MNKSALLALTLAASLGSNFTGLEGMTPSGVPTDKLTIYLFEKGIINKVCLSKFIDEFYIFHGTLLTKVSAQQVLNRLQRGGILKKQFNSEIKDFEYSLINK